MPGEMNQYVRGWLLPRKTATAIAQVNHTVAVQAHKVDGLSLMGELSMNRMVMLEASRSMAEQLEPNGTENYADVVQEIAAGIRETIRDLRDEFRQC